MKPTDKQQIHTTHSEIEKLTLEKINAELDELHDDWLERYLRENQLKLVNTEEIEAVLDHKIKLAFGKEDH